MLLSDYFDGGHLRNVISAVSSSTAVDVFIVVNRVSYVVLNN